VIIGLGAMPEDKLRLMGRLVVDRYKSRMVARHDDFVPIHADAELYSSMTQIARQS
jgi:hypothetical protein